MKFLFKSLVFCTISLATMGLLSAQTDAKPEHSQQLMIDEIQHEFLNAEHTESIQEAENKQTKQEVVSPTLSKTQKKSIKKHLRQKEIRKTLKTMFPKRHSNVTSATQPKADLLLVLITILLPPLGVALYEDGITTNFWIDLLLTLLFYLPGLIFALIIILD